MTGSFWNIGNKQYMFPTVKSALPLLHSTYTKAEHFAMHEFFYFEFHFA